MCDNDNMELMKFRLFVTLIYTLSGKKKLYSLGDMAYGEWLVFKKNQPYAHLNVLEYKGDPLKNEKSKIWKLILNKN